MPEIRAVSERFRALRERAGLTIEEAAARMEVSPFHIETTDDDFTVSYSAADVRRFCGVLGATPSELFGVATAEPPVSA
jgi:transcriptional regulator with XRE-family HTH domain